MQMTLLAILEDKKILSHDEAERIAKYMQFSPLPSDYVNALKAVKKITEKPD